nr:disease resistance-like protein csa1 [Quercus suber]
MKTLLLFGCTHLRSLPGLPLNIGRIDVDGCTSLEILPLRLEDGPFPSFCLLNCVKLINNEDYGDMLLTKLRHYIQFEGDEPIFDMTIPEREIPKWFSHQSVGALVNLQVPSSDLLCNKLKGVTVCAVFVLRQHHPLHQLHSDYEGGFRFMHRLQFYLKANGYGSQPIPSFPFSEEFGKIESYHLYLGSVPSTLFDANGLGQIEIGFETIGPGLEVTKCGARLIFEHDIKDLNQTMRGCSSCSITAYMDDLEDSAKDTKTK